MRRIVTAALLVTMCLLPLARDTMLISEPYGDSHDGRNGATWTASSAALRGDPIGSRMGAIRADGSVYANHPPGLTIGLAFADAAASPSPFAGRAVMVVGLWATILLTYWLLVGLQFARWVALAGTAALAATPMVRAYGSMVDTPIIALPIAVLILCALAQVGDGEPHLPAWGLIALAVGPLISWQLVWLEAVVCISLVLDSRRRRQAPSAVAAIAGGMALLTTWLLWVHGSLDTVVEQFLVRSSLDPSVDAGWGEAIRYQAAVLPSLLGLGLVVIPFGILRKDRRTRSASVAALVAVVGYAAILPNGAANHDYWMYWLVVPVAIGGASVTEAAWRLLEARSSTPTFRVTALLGLILLPLALMYGYTSDQELSTGSGVQAAELLASSDLARGEILWLLADVRPTDAWLGELGVDARHLTPQRLEALRRGGRSEEVVLASTACNVPGMACDALPFRTLDRSEYPSRQYALLRIADLQAD